MSVFNDNSSDLLHIWDNAAFDCADSVDAATSVRISWSTVAAFESSDKENCNVNLLRSPPSVDPLHLSTFVKDFPDSKSNEFELEQLDKEIEDVETEIDRLSSRLLELKRERIARIEEKRGRVALLEQDKKQRSDENMKRLKKLEESLTFPSPGSASHGRKGLTLGHSEIISASTMTRRMMKKMDVSSTPLNQNRKTCFWKVDKIDELKMTKERGCGGKRFSLSPRSTKATVKLPKQAVTTIASRKTWSKMDEKVTSSVLQPKKLFEEAVKKSTAVKGGRIVASKYNSGLRKRSLPENDESKENDKKRASLEVKSSSKLVELEQQQGSRVKKKWEIPTKVEVFNSCNSPDEDDKTPHNLRDVLPRIRTARCVDETSRDSGAVKRADDNKSLSVFCEDNEQVCHTLIFTDE